MKKCPFCAEEIQDEATKCRFCGEFLDVKLGGSQTQEPWYFKTAFIVIAFCTVGPLALPLVWWHPKYSVPKKVIVTVIILILTYFLTLATAASVKTLREYYSQIFDLLKT